MIDAGKFSPSVLTVLGGHDASPRLLGNQLGSVTNAKHGRILKPGQVYFRGAGFMATPSYARGALAPGMSFEGPAIITQEDSAPLVAPGFRARVDDACNILLERSRG